MADFLFCTRCGVLMGVLYQDGSRLYGTVNCAALRPAEALGTSVSVSPKRLESGEKTARWCTVVSGCPHHHPSTLNTAQALFIGLTALI
jgi:hypothetical protein